MIEHFLDEDEIVILQDSNVTDRVGLSVTLILTKYNIIEKRQNVWGKETGTYKYSLLELKDNNGKPNILVGKTSDGKTRLELYFLDQELYYQFKAPFAEKKWAAAITKAYKNCNADIKHSERSQFGVSAILSPIRGGIDSARNAIRQKQKDFGPIKTKCPKCGADLSGERGSEVKCGYCDNVVTLK